MKNFNTASIKDNGLFMFKARDTNSWQVFRAP